jgi:hypothetical protein
MPPAIPSLQARQALDKLTARYLQYPAVSLIDLGYDPQAAPGEHHPQLVLRIHLRPGTHLENLDIPEQVDGIPVRILSGDYHLE